MIITKLELPSEEFITETFAKVCETLGIKPYKKDMRDTVIYEMTDGMRTSTTISGSEAYFDGGVFSLRLINILRVLGMGACYVNVIEQKHRERDNYSDIFKGLQRLYSVYNDYAKDYGVRLKFVGDLNTSLEPRGFSGNFATELKRLEKRTANNTNFAAYILMNYSLDWALKNEQLFANCPDIHVAIRHTKLQFPTGMMLPPSKSDYSSLVYVQQGSSSNTWSDLQMVYLVALALRSKILNRASQYLKQYEKGEKDIIRSQREDKLYIVHRTPMGERLAQDILHKKGDMSTLPLLDASAKGKRAIIAGPFGPEIYEF